jgi:hypothetical protein
MRKFLVVLSVAGVVGVFATTGSAVAAKPTTSANNHCVKVNKGKFFLDADGVGYGCLLPANNKGAAKLCVNGFQGSFLDGGAVGYACLFPKK